MCLGVPGRVVQIHDVTPPAATVEVKGVNRNVSLALLPADEHVEVGDYVLIELGFAMNRMTAEEAAETAEMLEGFGEDLFPSPLTLALSPEGERENAPS